MDANIRVRKENAFVLWRVAVPEIVPSLVIGQLAAGAPVSLAGEQQFGLQQDAEHPDLWWIGADGCGLTDGGVYHYWFEVSDSAPYRNGQRIMITDPTACTVDWQMLAAKPDDPHYTDDDAYPAAACPDFFILDPSSDPSDPDAHNSRGNDPGNLRNGYGNTLFRYAFLTDSYDPVSGQRQSLSPARQLMKTALIRWMNDFRLDGIRMDSVENVANWDFVQEYKDLAWEAWHDLFPGDKDHFLVVGEELDEPLALLQQQRVDGLWHERFKEYIRYAITGQSADGEATFEWTIKKAIDCRNFGFTDLAQAVIYLTSHDVEGPRNERLYNFLLNNGIVQTEQRIKLAFVCLLTAVGIPMILAGEEFADQHDLFDQQGNVDQQGGKQCDPVDFSRLTDDWRSRIKEYVATLTACRTGNPALAVNDTNFIHMDFNEGKRVLAWQRGLPGSSDIVVVVANFSDYGTPDPLEPSSEYVVANWPEAPAGRVWQEVTQSRAVPVEWAGREPIYPWEAKVYQWV
jgi:pullulanase